MGVKAVENLVALRIWDKVLDFRKFWKQTKYLQKNNLM